jgi:hypothetical protein
MGTVSQTLVEPGAIRGCESITDKPLRGVGRRKILRVPCLEIEEREVADLLHLT